MSIARAFTTRRVKQSLQAADSERTPQRSASAKGSVGSIRNKISNPIQLVHTTNMLSYNAPDIHPLSASSTGSMPRSDDDMSDSAVTNGTTPPTSPDVESSPKRSGSPSPAPNHLSSFFTLSEESPAPVAHSTPPTVPQRAPSHSKKPYNTLVRQRSASAMSANSHRTVSTKPSLTFSRSSSSSTSTSVTTHSSSTTPAHQLYHRSKLSSASTAPATTTTASPPKPPVSPPQRPQRKDHYHHHSATESQQQHPFGPELAQVSEIAEEYGVKEQVNTTIATTVTTDAVDAEEQVMLDKGLTKLSADEYLSEVARLFGRFFGTAAPPPAPAPVAVAAAWPSSTVSQSPIVGGEMQAGWI
ncbi:hypothetical protein VTK26DRAFT_4638 [Humicola hyalothermophila]